MGIIKISKWEHLAPLLFSKIKINYQLSVISYQLPIQNLKSITNYQLPIQNQLIIQNLKSKINYQSKI